MTLWRRAWDFLVVLSGNWKFAFEALVQLETKRSMQGIVVVAGSLSIVVWRAAWRFSFLLARAASSLRSRSARTLAREAESTNRIKKAGGPLSLSPALGAAVRCRSREAVPAGAAPRGCDGPRRGQGRAPGCRGWPVPPPASPGL